MSEGRWFRTKEDIPKPKNVFTEADFNQMLNHIFTYGGSPSIVTESMVRGLLTRRERELYDELSSERQRR